MLRPGLSIWRFNKLQSTIYPWTKINEDSMNNTKMIFGAPGCGKTTYLINLLEDLLATNDPNKIAFVSFTKKGVYEGRDRAIEKFNYKEKDLPYFRTIHSLAFRDLGISRYEMISRKNYREFSKAMGMNFMGYYTEDLVNNDDKYLFQCQLERNNPTLAKRYETGLQFNKFQSVKKNYIRYKKETGIKDFDDLIVEFIKKDTPLPIDIAIIDEAQDLTSLQWEFCKVAFRNCHTVYIAGDDDQAIYEWSGADIKQFLQLTENSQVHILDKSYRLKKDILEFSKKISGGISNRVKKDFEPIDTGGTIQFYNRLEDVSINNEETYYMLCRNTYYLRGYKNYLMKKGLIFDYKNKPSVDMVKYKVIKKYEHLRKNEPHKIKRNTQLKLLLRKDACSNEVWYNAFEMPLEESNYYRDLFKNKTDVTLNKINVNTIHGVKGGEADNVILKLDITKRVSESLDSSKEAHDAELRCLYVALTRAKKNLHIVHTNSKLGYDNLLRSLV